MQRRQLLATLGALATAGCSGLFGGGGGSATPSPVPTDSPTPSAAGTATPTPTGTSTPTATPATTATDTATPGETATPTPTPEPTATGTPTLADAAVGEVIEGSTLAVVVRNVRRVTSLGTHTAGGGSVFLVVRAAVKNVARRYIHLGAGDGYNEFGGFLQPQVVDAEGNTYRRAAASTERPLIAGTLAPGEVTRGDIVFEVPGNAEDLRFVFDFEYFDRFTPDRTSVALGRAAERRRDLRQTLRIDPVAIGDAVERDGISVRLHAVDTVDALDEFTDAGEGWTFAVADVSATNRSDAERSLSILAQMRVKDGRGFTYRFDTDAYAALDGKFDRAHRLPPGDSRRGTVPYRVPAGRETLYWTFDFDVAAAGDKTFWRVR